MSRLRDNHDKSLFAPETAANIRVIVFVLASVVLMSADHRRHHLDVVRDTLATLVYPLQYLIQVPFQAGSWLTEHLASRSALLEENARLRQQQLFISVQLQKLAALEAENRRLRLLLESSVNIRERVLIAELISVDFDPYRHRILLNKGTYHGVHVGQPLLDADGIVGQIVRAHTLTSTAILITDPNHAIPVQDVRNGLRTLAVGTGNFQQLELPHIPNNDDIKVGDLLVTSGLGGRFPRGYPVAIVTQVEFDAGRPFARVIAKPTASLDRRREVLVIVNPPETTDAPLQAQRTPPEAPPPP